MARTLVFSTIAFTAGVVLTFLLLVVAHSYGYVSGFLDPAKQVELLAVYLAAATLVVTGVGVCIALSGIIGYALIKAEAISAATKAGAEAGERAISPLLERELLASRLGVTDAQAEEPTLDPLTQALTRKE
jgi:hypothetical protein